VKDIDKYDKLLNHKSEPFDGDEIAQFLQKSSTAKIPEGKGKQAIWDAIEANLSEEQAPSKTIKLNPWIAGGIAASIMLIVSLVLTFQSTSTPEKIHIIAESGTDVLHKLPDGSTVKLNASSSIFYYEKWDRSLSLSGEAFFEVTKGSKFVVKTRLGEVEVLGTSFNVFARDSTFEVSCKTGQVQVTLPDKSFVEVLQPGDQIVARVDTVVQTTINMKEIGNWTTGEFYFNNRPIREVLDEIERQYKTKIAIRNGDTLRFTGYFFREADILSTLDLICLPLGLSFEKQDGIYVIDQDAQEL